MDVIDRFLAQVQNHPDEPAVLDRDSTISYAELERLARRIATRLSQLGEHPRVVINLPQCAEAYAAMLGTLMAGGYYIPLNVSLPEFRKTSIIEQVEPEVFIGDLGGITFSPQVKERLTALSLDDLPKDEIVSTRPHAELAYIMFTSGSTGQPKGVMIKRTGLNGLIDWSIPVNNFGPGDRVGQFSNLGFDFSVYDMYTTLGSGAALAALGTKKDRFMPALSIKELGLTVWHSVPSVVDLMSQAKQVTPENLKSLRLMTFLGEPLRPQHLEILFEANPDMTIFNTYGPTEITVLCTHVAMQADNFTESCDSTVALGDTIPGWRIVLEGGPNEDEGEIVISSEFNALGYWKKPELTEKVFRTIELDGEVVPAYFTGDWAERVGGKLYFRNRIDRQVKIYGHRIELDEIDYWVRESGMVNACSVVKDDKIYTFLETTQPVDAEVIRKVIVSRLPTYAVPAKFIELSQFPRNQNDKIDVKALATLLD
mgnify:CR=1 FL=1|jgi:D-alanine--poly(phosphoribitol) ligase subunit 1